MSSKLLACAAMLAAVGLANCLPAAPPPSYPADSLPPCSASYVPCQCPDGATFRNLTTLGLIGAPAADVQAVIGSFFNIEYQGGLAPISTTGEDFVDGATRTFNLSGPSGYYEIAETLVSYTNSSDGSFVQVNEQSSSNPVVQIPGGGTFMGEWSIITGQQTLIPNETAVSWVNWRCEVGVTFDAAASHEGGINNATALLRAAGLDTGLDISAWTIWYAGEI